VDNSPEILSTLMSVPGLRQMTEAVVRATFFGQFVGGDTAHQTVPLLQSLRASNKGALFGYSVEGQASGKTLSLTSSRDGTKPVHKRIVDEMVRCIDVAADFEDSLGAGGAGNRMTWVATKMTALVPDAQALLNLSSYLVHQRMIQNNTRKEQGASSVEIAFPGCPMSSDLDVLYTSDPVCNGLTTENIDVLKDLHADLVRICTRAQERGVKIIIDAEHSWYQPAIDAFTLSLMRQFNKLHDSTAASNVQPLVYATFQAYLRRTPAYLTQSLLDAKANNYALGVKFVRGAYHSYEIAAHSTDPESAKYKKSLSISPDPYPPVWSTKADTDECYNTCARVLIRAIKDDVQGSSVSVPGGVKKSPTIGVLFGTHNWTSCNVILDELVDAGLALKLREEGREDVVKLEDVVTERITVGQLFGMSDALTNYLVGKTRSTSPFVIKYVPYGALSEVMPYLSRRAIENKSILGGGGAADERRRAGSEIWRKLFG